MLLLSFTTIKKEVYIGLYIYMRVRLYIYNLIYSKFNLDSRFKNLYVKGKVLILTLTHSYLEENIEYLKTSS